MSLITSHRGWQASHFRCRSQARINSEGHPTAARLRRGWTPDYRAKCSNLRPRPARAPPPSPPHSLPSVPPFFFSLPPISFLFSPIPPSPPSFSQGSQPGDLRSKTFSATNLPCPSCWSRSRVTAGGVATILSSFTHFLTLPPPLRNSPPCPGKDLWHRQQQQQRQRHTERCFEPPDGSPPRFT